MPNSSALDKASVVLVQSAWAWLVVVFAEIRLIVVICDTLLSRYSATADDACAQIRDYGVDLIGGQLEGR
jgi:hypothetical protein